MISEDSEILVKIITQKVIEKLKEYEDHTQTLKKYYQSLYKNKLVV